MADREKVIRGLECCAYDPDPGQELKEIRSCLECPYYRAGCSPQLIRDALALLKEQEARVMTWDEMVEAGKNEIPVYIEKCPKGDPVRDFWGFALPGIEPPKDKPFNYPGGVEFNAMNTDGEIWDGDFYGMNASLGWRAWTSRPSPEQMRDTKWEGESDE